MTPNPSVQEMREALPLVDSRPSVAVAEIIRRLEINLPALIDDVNSELALTGERKIVKPAGYYLAPAQMSDRYINSILVGIAVQTEPMGISGVFKNISKLMIYSIGERVEISGQIYEAFDRGSLIYGALFPFLDGCVDPHERIAWKTLEPNGMTFLPEDWSDYSGVMCEFTLTHEASHDNWL